MDFICDAYSALHVSWYAVVLATVFPMIATVSRSFALTYLIVYAMVCAWVVMYGTNFVSNTYNNNTSTSSDDNPFLPGGQQATLITTTATTTTARMMMMTSSKMDDEKVHIFRKIKLQNP